MESFISAGARVPQLDLRITREDLIRYAGAADDYVRQHWDHPFMTASGYPDVVVHGWLTFAHMCRAVTDWLPPDAWSMARFAVRYRRPAFPGLVAYGGEVIEVAGDTVQLACWARDETGNETTTSTISMRYLRARPEG